MGSLQRRAVRADRVAAAEALRLGHRVDPRHLAVRLEGQQGHVLMVEGQVTSFAHDSTLESSPH